MASHRNIFRFFTPSYSLLRKATKLAKQVDSLAGYYRKLSNNELSNKTDYFLDQLSKGKSLDDILPDALATAREAIYRVHGLYAYLVQIIGAIIIHNGDFAEMYTGEGKTITIVIAAYLNALLKKGVHVVTVNEYLVKRDAQFCAAALNPLKITVGYNLTNMKPNDKRKMFACDITYTTNSELGFDYLRDNMVPNYEDKVIRGLHYAIIDEADSVLIDEARTPLIIAGQPKKDVSLYIEVDEFVKSLTKEDYSIDAESRSIFLTQSGTTKAQNHYHLKNLYDVENSDLVHKIRNALMANYVFEYGVEYIVQNQQVLLVDHFTGRILHGRTYNAGLHQAIQAKEKVKIDPENVTVATITYQSFFRLYKKIAGVSGTAYTEAKEFLDIYNMVVVPVPTNKKVIRHDYNDYVFETTRAKWLHVVAFIKQLHEKGQPVLVGTASVEDSEELSTLMKNQGLKFELLNAKNHEREAEIIALAGQKGAITISTNMAGRGTDIKLGPGVKELGGLFVIGTNRNESRRIDNQLRGRSGRQGDPGETRFMVSLEDPLFKRFAGDKMSKATKKTKDDDFFDSWFFTRIIASMQKKIENLNYDTRKHLIDYDVVLSNQRELIYEQRDQILKNESNAAIIKKMVRQVSEYIVNLCISITNPTYIDSTALAKTINEKFFFLKILESSKFTNCLIPDAINLVEKILNISIQSRISTYEPSQIHTIIRSIIIQNLDSEWTQHLDHIFKIRESVNLRSLEQKSPLNIYVDEADKLFKMLIIHVAHKVIINIHNLYNPAATPIMVGELYKAGIISSAKHDELMQQFIAKKEVKIDFSQFLNSKATPVNPKKIIPMGEQTRLINEQNLDDEINQLEEDNKTLKIN